MKALFISEYFPPESKGGGEISSYLLARELAKKIKVHVLTSWFPGLKKAETKENIQYFRLLKTGKSPVKLLDNAKRLLLFERTLVRELKTLDKKEDYDIIHCFNITSIAAAKLKKKINKRFIAHINSPVAFCPKGTLMYKDIGLCNKKCTLLNYIKCLLSSKSYGKSSRLPFIASIASRKRFKKYQRLMKSFDYYMPISSFMEKRLIMFGINKKKIKVIYNINDYGKFLKLKIPNNRPKKILYLGEYSYPKGPNLILEALKNLNDKSYKCSFYGSGELKNKLIEFAKKHRINAKINPKVPYRKIPEIMEKHDIVIIPSFVAEAFSRVALEACAAGKTVIASRIGGIKDIIEDKKNGFLFSPGNIGELQLLIKKALAKTLDPKLVRKCITDKFSNKKTIDDVLKIYKELSEK